MERQAAHTGLRDMGLGSWPYVSLLGGRRTAFEFRKLARDGGDPRLLRFQRRAPSFAQAARTVIGIHDPGWKDGGKSGNQWSASPRDNTMPRLGKLAVSKISMAVLLPIWNEKSETARRVRQRIGAIKRWAVAKGHRRDDPAGDALGVALPTHSAVKKHHRALPHAKFAAAIAMVRAPPEHWATVASLRYLILTGSRA